MIFQILSPRGVIVVASAIGHLLIKKWEMEDCTNPLVSAAIKRDTTTQVFFKPVKIYIQELFQSLISGRFVTPEEMRGT